MPIAESPAVISHTRGALCDGKCERDSGAGRLSICYVVFNLDTSAPHSSCDFRKLSSCSRAVNLAALVLKRDNPGPSPNECDVWRLKIPQSAKRPATPAQSAPPLSSDGLDPKALTAQFFWPRRPFALLCFFFPHLPSSQNARATATQRGGRRRQRMSIQYSILPARRRGIKPSFALSLDLKLTDESFSSPASRVLSRVSEFSF